MTTFVRLLPLSLVLSPLVRMLYPDDPLWDEENCGSQSTCCELHDPPYFCKSLTEPMTDDVEVRICGDQVISQEDSPIQLIEIYVQ